MNGGGSSCTRPNSPRQKEKGPLRRAGLWGGKRILAFLIRNGEGGVCSGSGLEHQREKKEKERDVKPKRLSISTLSKGECKLPTLCPARRREGGRLRVRRGTKEKPVTKRTIP